jgi:NAD(P)-dependent dehydrogenase (short-subunit alcohol dehydrogenase family)
MATAAPNHDQSKTAIIVGASRGLGLGPAREFARRGWQITATARGAAAATELADAVAASDGGIAVEEVDIDRAESVDALATRLADRRFSLVFINAGISGPQHQSVDAATFQTEPEQALLDDRVRAVP